MRLVIRNADFTLVLCILLLLFPLRLSLALSQDYGNAGHQGNPFSLEVYVLFSNECTRIS